VFLKNHLEKGNAHGEKYQEEPARSDL